MAKKAGRGSRQTWKQLFVGLDVGGTSMKAGVVDDRARVLATAHSPTEAAKGQEYGLKQMCATIRQAVANAKIELDQVSAIGVATPGTMDIPAGIILDPPNLHPWQNVPVREFIRAELELPTAFQNDANAAAMGEYWAGAGKRVHSMVLFTLGTGVGGGIIIGDSILQGEHSHGAELGHQKIEMTSPRQCGCGRWGCLEAYASATSVVKRTEEALQEGEIPTKLKAARLTAEKIFEAAKSGDRLGKKIVDETAFCLAVGATNMLHTIDPDMVVFGGGMTAAGTTFLNRIRKYVRELAFPVPAEKAQLKFASLGSDAGFIGAAACARQLFLRGS